MLRFWNWLVRYAERKAHEAYMAAHHCDQACVHCGTWQGPLGGWLRCEEDTPAPHHLTLTCRKCKQPSTWADTGILMIPVDPATLEQIKWQKPS
jgi:hypothetical protein